MLRQFLIAFVLMGVLAVGACAEQGSRRHVPYLGQKHRPLQRPPPSDAVWVDAGTHEYFCRGDSMFGQRRGHYEHEFKAKMDGSKAGRGHNCDGAAANVEVGK